MPKGATPKCPNCGDLFPFKGHRDDCKKCGLPITVASEGAKAVARWRKHPQIVSVDVATGITVVTEDRRVSKRERKRRRVTVHRQQRRMFLNKHGRQHA
jgi:hypothetical protein